MTSINKPADILNFKNSSLLDTVFTSKHSRKPAWLTTTHGAQTTLWQVTRSGKLQESVKIIWAEPDKKTETLVQIKDETFPAEKFGHKSEGGFFSKDRPRKWTFDGKEFEWRLFEEDLSVRTAEAAPFAQFSYWVRWRCSSFNPPADTKSSSISRFKSMLSRKLSVDHHISMAEFTPPIDGDPKNGLQIYQEGLPYTFILLLSAILVSARADDWKKNQSPSTPEEIEQVLAGDVLGSLPAYTPLRSPLRSKVKHQLHPTIPSTTPWKWSRPNTS